jgi:peptide deformylase
MEGSIGLREVNGKPTLMPNRPMSLPIVHYSDPILRRKGEKITVFDTSLAALSAAMIETMHAANGIGLAAQQVGRAVQVCVVDLRPVEVDFSWEFDGTKPPLELFMSRSLAKLAITFTRKAAFRFPPSAATSPVRMPSP